MKRCSSNSGPFASVGTWSVTLLPGIAVTFYELQSQADRHNRIQARSNTLERYRFMRRAGEPGRRSAAASPDCARTHRARSCPAARSAAARATPPSPGTYATLRTLHADEQPRVPRMCRFPIVQVLDLGCAHAGIVLAPEAA